MVLLRQIVVSGILYDMSCLVRKRLLYTAHSKAGKMLCTGHIQLKMLCWIACLAECINDWNMHYYE